MNESSNSVWVCHTDPHVTEAAIKLATTWDGPLRIRRLSNTHDLQTSPASWVTGPSGEENLIAVLLPLWKFGEEIPKRGLGTNIAMIYDSSAGEKQGGRPCSFISNDISGSKSR